MAVSAQFMLNMFGLLGCWDSLFILRSAGSCESESQRGDWSVVILPVINNLIQNNDESFWLFFRFWVKSKVFDLPVDPHLHPQLWVLTERTRSQIQAA